MMRLKKWLAAVLALVMALGLAACGGGVDKTPLVEAYNKASASFDEVGILVNENADYVAPEMIEALNSVSEMLLLYEDLAARDEELTQEQVDEAISFLETVPGSMAQIKAGIEQDLAAAGVIEGE